MRLLQKSLTEQIRQLTGAIFMVIFMIAFIFMILKVLNYANQAQADQSKLMIILALSIVVYFPQLIIGSTFLATINVLNKCYQNHEMQVWFSSGVSLRQFIPIVLKAAIPYFLFVWGLLVFVNPWCYQQLSIMKAQAQNQQNLSFLLSGEFFEIGKDANKKVLFIESVNPEQKTLQSIFISQNNSNLNSTTSENFKNFEEIDLITANHVKIESRKIQNNNLNNNNLMNFAVLSQGQHYLAKLNNNINNENNDKNLESLEKPKMQIFEFAELALPIQTKQKIATGTDNVREVPSKTLWKQYRQKNIAAHEIAELIWRLSMPFCLLVLPLVALATTYQQVRKTKYWPMVTGIVIYFAYNNIINLLQTLLEKKRIHFAYNDYIILILHGLVAILAIAVIVFRSQGYLYFKNRLFK